MKKLVLFCAVAAAVSFAACTSKPAATEEAVEVVAVEEVACDSCTNECDSCAAPCDTCVVVEEVVAE